MVVLAVLGAACTESDLVIDARFDPLDRDPVVGDVADADDVVAVALADVETYWETELPDTYGIDFEPLEGGLVPYGPDSPLPECGQVQLRYEDIAENALYCPDEDLVAWDRVALMPDLNERFGPLTVGIVMAHEFAHAIQNRADVEGTTVTLELQADCFAGAWVDDVDDRLELFRTDGDALDSAIGGFLELRDSVGVSARDPAAHGSAFDRVSAFQQGFESGPEVCASFETSPPVVVAIPFGSVTDLENEGNLPVDDLLEPLRQDLESFYGTLLERLGVAWRPLTIELVDPARDEVECGGEILSGRDLELASFYCSPDAVVYLDGADLVPALAEIGDFAVGGELARQYSFAALDQLGSGGELGRQADCLTGAYVAAEFEQTIPEQQLVLSPGDIDEILTAFLAFGEQGATAFERTSDFRVGFEDGAAACEAIG